MNLTKRPTIDQFKRLIASYDDDSGSHVLYVDKEGNVLLRPFILCQSAGNGVHNPQVIQFRFEVFPQGWGYVGSQAVEDDSYLTMLYSALYTNWHNKTTGCINDW